MERPQAGTSPMCSTPTRSRISQRWARLLPFYSLLTAVACASVHTVHRLPAPPVLWTAPPAIVWHAPVASKDATHLSRWRAAAGPPILREGSSQAAAAGAVTIVTWNVAVGAGDLRALVATLPPQSPLILMLQEVVRSGVDVPSRLPPGAVVARAKGGRRLARYRDVTQAAAELGLSLYYVPSMRLDHLFFRLPAGCDHVFGRAASRFGSDHYPLVGTVQVR